METARIKSILRLASPVGCRWGPKHAYQAETMIEGRPFYKYLTEEMAVPKAAK
jgi:hypothetical protein